MDIADAVAYALHSMEMEGFAYTEAEKRLWGRIAAGELPLSAAVEGIKQAPEK